MYDAPILIIGGNGKTGRRVDLLLKEQGIATRPVSRSTPIPFDWSRPDGWGAVMEGARKAYVATARDIDYRRISPDEFAERLHPVTEREIIDLLNELFTVVLDGRNTCIADGVERALGRPAKDFADYARETAASGVWDKLEQD
jgi:hypothetical protein